MREQEHGALVSLVGGQSRMLANVHGQVPSFCLVTLVCHVEVCPRVYCFYLVLIIAVHNNKIFIYQLSPLTIQFTVEPCNVKCSTM